MPDTEAPVGFSGGTLKDFTEKVGVEVSEKVLEHWREQLQAICNARATEGRAVVVAGDLALEDVEYAKPKKGEPQLVPLNDFSYHYITDKRLTPVQRLRHEVLALAGHELAARLVLVDRSEAEQFYGTAIAIQRQVASLREGGRPWH